MFPLTAIPPALPAQHIAPQPDVAAPGLDLPAGRPSAPAQPNSDSFGNLFARMVEEVNSRQVNAAEAVQSLQSGGNVSLHQTVIAMEEANVSFQLMVEVRNRLLESYQEIMRMQV